MQKDLAKRDHIFGLIGSTVTEIMNESFVELLLNPADAFGRENTALFRPTCGNSDVRLIVRNLLAHASLRRQLQRLVNETLVHVQLPEREYFGEGPNWITFQILVANMKYVWVPVQNITPAVLE